MSAPSVARAPALRIVLDLRTATPHFPGIGRYATSLADALAPQLAADEELVLLEPPQGTWPFRPAPAHSVRRVVVEAAPFDLAQQWQLPDVLRHLGNGPTVYHSLYYLMPYRPGQPTVLTFYDLIPLRFPAHVSGRARLLFRFTMQLALRAAQHVVAISEASRRDLLASFQVAPDQVTTTLLAPDPRFQPPSTAAVAALRSKYDLPERFVLYLGINKPHKNLLTLVQAYGRIAAVAPPLVIAGAWDERYPETKQLAAALGLEQQIRFLGPVDDAALPSLYAAATVFVFPSRYEGFGLPVLEAMACGTPVIASNISSLPEIAGAAARLVDPLDSAALAGLLRTVLDSPAEQQRLTAAGLARARQFTWAATAATTLAVYRAVAARQTSR